MSGASLAERLLTLALAHQRGGALTAAIAAYRRLEALLPHDATAPANAALALLAAGRTDAAARACRHGLILAPELASLHRVTADIAARRGQSAAADAAFRSACCLQPDAAETANNFANFLAALADPAAAHWFRHAVRLAPSDPVPHANLATHRLSQGEVAGARSASQTALLLSPDHAPAYNVFGNALLECREDDEALAAYGRARQIDPWFLDACINQSGVRLDLGHVALGARLARLALLMAPDQTGPYNNLGNGELLACHLPAAESVFRRGLRLDPSDAQLHFNFAAILLKQGKFAEGWAEYEWRHRTPAALRRRRAFDPPAWMGGDLAGTRLLLSAEQGFGDTLQFCRMAPWLAARGARITLRAPAPLVRLLGSLQGVERVIDLAAPPPACDAHLWLMSIPAHFPGLARPTPDGVPYLAADPSAVAVWRRRLSDFAGRKIGLVWSGAPRPGQRAAHLLDRRRSLAAGVLSPWAAIDDVTWVSLQLGMASHAPPALAGLLDWTAELADFADSAALVSALDLVITVDSAVAHLAGALGRPVWILSRFDGCWRWLHDRDDTPWYPTARLFRQRQPGDWHEPIAAMAAAFNKM